VARLFDVSTSALNLALGLVGILGGSVLLAAFVVEIDPDLNPVRLVLFNAGAIAIVVAVHRRQAGVSPRLALLAAVPAILANTWYLAMTAFATGRAQPFAGEFGLVYFYAGLAMWLTDAVFGLVTLRLGVASRWAALALTIGSVLAITGIDRLGLTSLDNSTIFGPLALTGVALNGIGWILLAIEVGVRSPRGGAGNRFSNTTIRR